MVHRRAVPPGVQVDAVGRPSAVQVVHPRRARRTRPSAPRRCARLSVAVMKLCGFEVGLDQPLFLIAGPCVVESEQLQMDVAGQLKEIAARARHAVHLQVELRQGQPLERHVVSRPGHGQGPRDPGQGQARARRAGADRRAPRRRDRGGRAPSSTCCRRRRSSAGRPISSAPSRRAASRSTSRRASSSRRTT